MRKGRLYKEELLEYVGIWSQIRDYSTSGALVAYFHPLPTLRSRSDAVEFTRQHTWQGTHRCLQYTEMDSVRLRNGDGS